MKKSLFAIAAVTAFAGAAQAQSSVTVYGILDVGYTGGSLAVQQANGVGNTAMNVGRISNNMESGSRIGFRGTEDLGGGTSAQFVAEFGYQPAGNAGSNSNGLAAAPLGSTLWSPDIRQGYIGITQKGAGNVRIGTQNTFNWENAGSNTVGQLNQTLGSMLAPTTAGAGFPAASLAYTTSFANRTNNTITIRSESMSGFMVKAGYNQSNQSSNIVDGAAVNGVNNQSGYQLAVDWVAGKANVQASYAAFTSENTTAAANPVLWGSAVQGTNVKDNQMLITASYDFGVLKAFAGYGNRTATSTVIANNQLSRNAYEIGVRSFITPKVELWASGGLGTYNPVGVGGNAAPIQGYQVGSNYWLSKRTNLYVIAGANNMSATSASGGNAATGATNANQYSVGARHTF